MKWWMRWKWLCLALGLFTLIGPSTLRGATHVEFKTPVGAMVVEMNDREKPITVSNFVNYVLLDRYATNLFFHRCVSNFVLQGGGYTLTDRNSTNLFSEYFPVKRLSPITNEYFSGSIQSNVFGTIAMAKQDGDPNSATSEWFFNLADNRANLDFQNGGFTVFGRVSRGIEVLEHYKTLYKSSTLTQVEWHGIVDLRSYFGAGAVLFANLPVQYQSTRYPHYEDLHWVEVRILFDLNLTLSPTGTRQIHWRPLPGRIHHIESASSLQGPWSVLTDQIGEGDQMTTEDTAPLLPGQARFYRVRVDRPSGI